MLTGMARALRNWVQMGQRRDISRSVMDRTRELEAELDLDLDCIHMNSSSLWLW